MSNKVVDIVALRKQFAENLSIEEWQGFARKQHEIIEHLQEQIKLLSNKNSQLENLISSKFDGNLITHLTDEEQICIEQISRLQKQSMERQLTLEEVKRLDLLVKNLKLIREESTIVVNNLSDNMKEADLVTLIRSGSSDSDS